MAWGLFGLKSSFEFNYSHSETTNKPVAFSAIDPSAHKQVMNRNNFEVLRIITYSSYHFCALPMYRIIIALH